MRPPAMKLLSFAVISLALITTARSQTPLAPSDALAQLYHGYDPKTDTAQWECGNEQWECTAAKIEPSKSTSSATVVETISTGSHFLRRQNAVPDELQLRIPFR